MKRVLIVDDSVFLRRSMRTMMEANGIEVIGEAENGQKALEMYNELKPDIVTLDITMPVMDGIEALKQLKLMDKNARVIIVSALGQETKVKEAVKAGAIAFIVKPFKADTLIKTLS